MSSMISSRRSYVSARRDVKTGGNGLAIVALIAGVVLMGIGLNLNVTAVFAIGSIAFACSFLYLNAMFWAKRMDKMDYKPTNFRNYYF